MPNPDDVSESFAQLLAGNDESLVQDVYDRIADEYDWSMLDFLPEVNSPLRIVGDVIQANFFIGESGFYTLLISHLIDLKSVPNSFDAIGARAAAQTIRNVYATLPDSVLSSPPETRYELVNRSDFSNDHLFRSSVDGSGEAGYFDHRPEPWDFAAKYIREHAIDFADFFAATERHL